MRKTAQEQAPCTQAVSRAKCGYPERPCPRAKPETQAVPPVARAGRHGTWLQRVVRSHGQRQGQRLASATSLTRTARPKTHRKRARAERGKKQRGNGGAPVAGRRSGSRGAGRSGRGQYERICLALPFHISSVMLECSLWCTTSAEGASNGKRVLVEWSHAL